MSSAFPRARFPGPVKRHNFDGQARPTVPRPSRNGLHRLPFDTRRIYKKPRMQVNGVRARHGAEPPRRPVREADHVLLVSGAFPRDRQLCRRPHGHQRPAQAEGAATAGKAVNR